MACRDGSNEAGDCDGAELRHGEKRREMSELLEDLDVVVYEDPWCC